jgi:hypothetical protein
MPALWAKNVIWGFYDEVSSGDLAERTIASES